MATWTKQQKHARLEAQRRYREKQKHAILEAQRRYREKHNKVVKPKSQYWPERRLMNLIQAGIIIPEIEEEK